jgi:hypothetical protein
MNEIQLIRAQLDLERAHADTVAGACAVALGRATPASLASGAPLETFRQACVDYLVCVLAWFEERDRRLAGLIGQYGPEHPTRDALDAVLARRGRSREALEKLEAAFAAAPDAAAAPSGARQPWAEFAQFFSSTWSTRRDALDALLATNSRARDWRLISGVDADSILEERSRYTRVKETLPRGLTLATGAGSAAP